MSLTATIQHLVCLCNTTWNSILPPPPCPYHTAQAYNGLCYCRGHLYPHPFHGTSCGRTFTPSEPVEEYVGKHRKPETKESA